MKSALFSNTYASAIFCILLFWTINGCKTVPPDRYLTQSSQLYIGSFEIKRVPNSPTVEFLAGGVGWQGFQSNHFRLQLEILQGTASASRELELDPLEQPFLLKDRAIFLFPVREVTWGRRGSPEERMNLNRDFEACFNLLEATTDALLARQCYRVSGDSISVLDGQRVTLSSFPEQKQNDPETGTSESEEGLPSGIPGKYLSTSELPGLGMGLLALDSSGALWTPADSGNPIKGTWEIQGELILVRWSGKEGLFLLKRDDQGLVEMNSSIRLRIVD